MTTHISTSNPVRSDVTPVAPVRPSRTWALAGIGSGLAGIGVIVTSGMVNAVYDPDLVGDTPAIAEKLSGQTGPMFVFHTFATVGAVLLVVFAAGLFRRLRTAMGDASIAPLVAFGGLFGTAVVSVVGSGLNTEFMLGLSDTDPLIDPANAVLYNHWIGTIPWVWMLAGLAGLALYAASRVAAAPRWVGRTGLVLGGLTVLLGISPFQYMAGMTGPLLVLVVALGFRFGDRAAQ